ncbi:MAG: 50S ribosomal protein L17 [Candidatus Paceibacterota bacterium]
MTKLGRTKDQREALVKNQCRDLMLREKIKTTLAKAKETQKFTEKIITKAKKDNQAVRRELSKHFNKEGVEKALELGERYQSREGGYTRILKTGPRQSDGAEMAIIELV